VTLVHLHHCGSLVAPICRWAGEIGHVKIGSGRRVCIAIVHVISRVVRRCFLLGNDPVTGKNFDHRKVWIEDRLQQLAAAFGIDLLAFSCLSNHFHLILRSRPDVVATWDDTEVARRWLLLCPVRKSKDGQPEVPNEFELNSIRHDPERLAKIRMRLSDISWWMRLLCQNIAQRANRDDGEVGKFFRHVFVPFGFWMTNRC